MTTPSLARRAAAEGIGTALLLAAVVGSGILGERLAGGSVGLALLANSLATGAALAALVATFAPLSGAHFNPVITLAAASWKDLAWRDAPAYVAAQVAGAFAGVAAAHAMFGAPLFSLSRHERSGPAQAFSEAVATFGLVLLVAVGARRRPSLAPLVVGGYIVAAYWFTASTSFANPAVTLARAASDTFSGIRPVDAAPFVAAQIVGAAAAAAIARWLVPSLPQAIEAPRAAAGDGR